MKRVVGLIGAGALASVLAASLGTFPAAPGHRPFHINCPPGSHGLPRYAGEGQRLERARAEAARGLESRRLTVNHPPL